MPSAPFETAILTTALYGVLLMALNMFLITQQLVFRDSIRIRLGEVANQMAYELTCIYSMCQQVENDVVFFKPVEIPAFISGIGYVVELREIEGVWFVATHLEGDRSLNASSPFTKQGEPVNVKTVSGTLPVESSVGSYIIHYECENGRNTVHSGRTPVVWAEKRGETITVGLGWAESSGGG